MEGGWRPKEVERVGEGKRDLAALLWSVYLTPPVLLVNVSVYDLRTVATKVTSFRTERSFMLYPPKRTQLPPASPRDLPSSQKRRLSNGTPGLDFVTIYCLFF